MRYRSLGECIRDLESHKQLVRIETPIDARLEAAALHRRVHAAGGPALLFCQVTNCRFPMASNLFGTPERARFLFRSTLKTVSSLIRLKIDPREALRAPHRQFGALRGAWTTVPAKVLTGPVLACEIGLRDLPQLVSWPRDGGPYITLPIVYTEDPGAPGTGRSNLGMYRVQLSGNAYAPDREVGLHYQIHRGIGVHHASARALGRPLQVNVLVGGPPALMLAAVMPLPEGMSELAFAGALAGRRMRLAPQPEGLPICVDADFCIAGEIDVERLLPEGPFGDHLGYYSLEHPFPVLKVRRVCCRRDAIWPFTVVGRPPQEDAAFGSLIHELTSDAIAAELPGVHAVHAVDDAGVHPLLLAVGSERYMPFLEAERPQELLTQAHAILGQGQLSLAKYLFIAARDAQGQPDVHDVAAFLAFVLRRADWTRDLHFHTQTTIDTLDYSGAGLNAGSKVVVAANGPPRFHLESSLPSELCLPDGFRDPRVAFPGALVASGPRCQLPSFDFDLAEQARRRYRKETAADIERLCAFRDAHAGLNRFRWVVIVDDSQFTCESLRNFLWVVFTRSNPADDVYGIDAFVESKHWGCRGALVIDARIKPHHAPILEEDPQVAKRLDELAARGGPLHGVY